MVANVSVNSRRLSWLILAMISSSDFLGRGQVVELRLQRAGPRFQLGQFLQRFEVDAAEPAELAAQLGDFLVGCADRRSPRVDAAYAVVSLRAVCGPWTDAGVQLGQLELVILAEPLRPGCRGGGGRSLTSSSRAWTCSCCARHSLRTAWACWARRLRSWRFWSRWPASSATWRSAGFLVEIRLRQMADAAQHGPLALGQAGPCSWPGPAGSAAVPGGAGPGRGHVAGAGRAGAARRSSTLASATCACVHACCCSWRSRSRPRISSSACVQARVQDLRPAPRRRPPGRCASCQDFSSAAISCSSRCISSRWRCHFLVQALALVAVPFDAARAGRRPARPGRRSPSAGRGPARPGRRCARAGRPGRLRPRRCAGRARRSARAARAARSCATGCRSRRDGCRR